MPGDRILRLAVVVDVVLLVLWLTSRLINERLLVTAVLADIPQVFFLALPAASLLLAALARNPRAAAVAAAGVVVVAWAFMGLQTGSPSDRPRDLRVVTWNVAKWMHGADAIAAGLRAIDADVVCLQEAGAYHWLRDPQAQPSTLAAAMAGYAVVHEGELMVLSRLPVRSRRARAIPPGPTRRPLLEVDVDVKGTSVAVFCVHMMPTLWRVKDSIDRGEAHDADLRGILDARLAQAEQVQEIVTSSSSPSVLLGDLNSHPHALVGTTLRGELVDAFAAAGRGFGFTLGPEWPRARYDRVLVKGVEVRRAVVDSSAASDHFPLVADVALR
ncbi:MAG: endonuclease/exonuclease/phosphatase family protein [Deltaproteobacteria bacterium]|nr:endonuclease/exonuclease/phosphatase family protein [Deltaproteobacteria bacterium]